MHSLTSLQKKYIRKNIYKKSADDIASDLDLSAEIVLSFLEKRWGKNKYQQFLFKNGHPEEILTKNNGGIYSFIKTNKNALLLLFCLVLVSYINSVNNGFVSDDIPTIPNNPQLGKIVHIFNDPLAAMERLIHGFIFLIFGINPAFFRLSNIFFHLANTWLIYYLLSFFHSQRIAITAAAFFAVHPLMVESVTWISGGQYVRYTFFFLLSFIAYIKSKYDFRLYWASIFFFILSLFASSKGVTMLFAFILYDLINKELKNSWKKLLPFFCASLLFGIALLGLFNVRTQALENIGYQEIQKQNIFLLIPVAVTTYLQLIVWPDDLTLYHTEMSFSAFSYLIRLLIIIIGTGGIIYSYKKNRLLFLWLMLFIFALLPFLTPWGLSWIVAERYFYLSSIGIFASIAIIINDVFSNQQYKKYLIVIITIIISLLTSRTIIRNIDWKNEDNLWIATAKTSPSGHQIHNNLGDVYARRGDFTKAIEEFKKATEINPNYADAYHNLAHTYHEIGKIDEAITYYEKALSINPRLWQSYESLSNIYQNQQEKDKAAEMMKKAEEINPQIK